jgi:hypothetical protein
VSGLDELSLDADGFLDMEAFPDVDLTDGEVVDLRAALHADPVDEPTDGEWAHLVDGAVTAEPVDDGPFAMDDVAVLDESFDADDASPEVADDGDAADPSDDDPDGSTDDAEADPADAASGAVDADLDVDLDLGAGDDAWAVDDADVGLDSGADDLFPDHDADAALPEIVPDIEDLL